MFKKLFDSGVIQKRNTLQYWSTGLNDWVNHIEAEQEKITFIQTTLWLIFKSGDYKLLVWTTTPWTVFDNEFIVMDKKVQYVLTEGNYICSKYYADHAHLKIIGPAPEIKSVINPSGRTVPVIYNRVIEMVGTGIIHGAPMYSDHDYKIMKSRLPERIHIEMDTEKIIEQLKQNCSLYMTTPKEMTFYVCPRTGKQLIRKMINSWGIPVENKFWLLLKRDKEFKMPLWESFDSKVTKYLENPKPYEIKDERGDRYLPLAPVGGLDPWFVYATIKPIDIPPYYLANLYKFKKF